MFRVFVILLVLVMLGLGLAWYSVQTIPDWLSESKASTSVDSLSERIRRDGIKGLARDKLKELLDGDLTLSEDELNAIVLARLKTDKNGRKLINASDTVRTIIHSDRIEVGVLLNLKKLERIDPKSKKFVERLRQAFPLIKRSQLAVSLYGTPSTRNGGIVFRDDVGVSVGNVSISSELLSQFGVDTNEVTSVNLKVKYLSVKSVQLDKGVIHLKVSTSL